MELPKRLPRDRLSTILEQNSDHSSRPPLRMEGTDFDDR